MATNSTYAKLSDGDLADALGRCKAAKAPLEREEESLKAEIQARGLAIAEGEHYRVTCSPVPQLKLDTKRLKAEQPAVYSQYSYTSTVLRVTCTARLGQGLAA